MAYHSTVFCSCCDIGLVIHITMRNALKTSKEFFSQSTVSILPFIAMMRNMKDVIALDVHCSRICMMQHMISTGLLYNLNFLYSKDCCVVYLHIVYYVIIKSLVTL